MYNQKILLATLFTACLLLSGAGVGAEPSSTLPRYPIYPVLSPEVRISTLSSPTDYSRFQPAAAYDSIHNQYLVVWYNQWPGNRDIYGQRVSGAGTLIGSWFAISAGTNDRFQPALAFSATSQKYLVVWMYDVNGDGSKYEIWGRTVSWSGATLGTEKQIFTWDNRSFFNPRVAWNSARNEFMVISSVWDTQNSWWNDIAGKRVTSDGNTPYDGFQVFQDPTYAPTQGAINYNAVRDEYLVVWRQTGSTTDWDIYAARIAWNGGNPPSTFALANETSAETYPTIANNSLDAYFLAFMRYVNISSKYDLCFRLLNLDGNAYYAGDTSAHCITLGRSFLSPDVENIPGTDTWLVTTEFASDAGHQVFAMFIELGNTTIDLATYTVAADTPGWTFTNPIVTTGAPGFLIAYEGLTGSIPGLAQHIYGRILNLFPCFLPLIQR